MSKELSLTQNNSFEQNKRTDENEIYFATQQNGPLINNIENKIFTIREMQVMLDSELAKLYTFVEAARGMGAGTGRIMLRHILPNSITPILVQASLDVGTVILATTGLAFIGLGSQPPAADWGLMIEDGRALLRTAWWTSTFPGVAIFLSVLSFNLVGDAMRDLFDPKEYR